MNYGLYLSASGMQTAMYRMDVFANNLANMSTVGFKRDMPATRQRDVVRIEDGVTNLPSNKMLEALGGGVMLAPTRVVREQGVLEPTPNPLDVGIQGTGFMVVRQSAGTGPDNFKLTRDGRLTINRQGTLVQSTSGFPVLDSNDRPITLESRRPVRIDADGNVSQDGKLAGRIHVVDIADAGALRKQGDNLLSVPADVMARRTLATNSTIQQGTVERSTVDPIRATMQISSAERAVSRGARMIQIHDEVMQRAINTFGKIA